MGSKAANNLAAVLTGNLEKVKAKAKVVAPVDFKAPLPKKKGQPPTPRPRPVPPPARGPKPAQRGRSPERKPQASRGKSESPFSRKNRGQAMKDRSRSRSRSASITREPALPTDPHQLAELEAFKQQQQQGKSWNVMDCMPKSRMSQDEKKNLTKQLAEEEKGRQKAHATRIKLEADLRAQKKELDKREAVLAEKERKLAAAERGEWVASYGVGKATAKPSPGPGYEVGFPINWPRSNMAGRPTSPIPTSSSANNPPSIPIHRQTRMQTPPPVSRNNGDYAVALGKKRKSSKKRKKPKKGSTNGSTKGSTKKRGKKVSKKN